ncbi:MAG: flavodoxin domain-containing protein [Anaerolineales bacterium]
MKKILVAYATMAGSTAEVAGAVAEEISKSGVQVEVLPISEVGDLRVYDGIVVGAPMIMGWHRQAKQFLKKHRIALQQVPLAVFVLAISLTETGEMNLEGVEVTIDENLPKPPEKAGKLSFQERYAQLSKYLNPILRSVRPVQPVGIGVFGGRLEYGRLKWWAVLFVMLVIKAPAGDRRNWAAIRAWAAGLPALMQIEAV